MYQTVMLVFSGTEVAEPLFRKGLKFAKKDGARLVLLNVRHLHQADHLGEILSSDAFMGRGTVESLKRSVKEQRDHVVLRELETMKEEAEQAGLEVEVRAVKGPYGSAVSDAARDAGADLLLIEDRPECAHITGPFEVVRVRLAGHDRRKRIKRRAPGG